MTVEDAESDISLIELIFESPDGGDDVKVNIDYGPNLDSDNIYRSGLDIPQSDQPGGIQGGFWKIKSLRLKDSFENERLYRQDELPDTGFWVNNPVTSKQSIVGNREIGQTLTINTDTIEDADIDNLAPGTFIPNYEYKWQISSNGVDDWQDISAEETYTLKEADANKYFRSIVSYDGEEGVITETIESAPFQFTEDYSGSQSETFENGLSNGWKYDRYRCPGFPSSSIGHFIGRLLTQQQLKRPSKQALGAHSVLTFFSLTLGMQVEETHLVYPLMVLMFFPMSAVIVMITKNLFTTVKPMASHGASIPRKDSILIAAGKTCAFA